MIKNEYLLKNKNLIKYEYLWKNKDFFENHKNINNCIFGAFVLFPYDYEDIIEFDNVNVSLI